MILKKLEMDNFMPFYLHHEIDFSPKNGNKIVLLKGANGAGKSSTFAAMHFVFFGAPVPTNEDTSATSKQAVLEIYDLVNTKRISQDSGVTSVTAIFTHESVTYEMTRKINFKKIDVTKPAGMSDAEYTKKIDAEKKKNCIEGEFIVSENSTPHPWSNDPSKAQKQQNQYIESIISKESSRYYFFDGEKISGYTNTPPSENIKSVIEKLLGIKAIENLVEDLEELQTSYGKQKRKFAASISQAATYAKLAEVAEGDKTYAERQRTDTQDSITHANRNIKRYTAELSRNQIAAQKLAERGTKIQEKKDAEDGMVNAQTSLTKFYSDKFPILLTLEFLGGLNQNNAGLISILPHTAKTAADCLQAQSCICKKPFDAETQANLEALCQPNSNPLENFEECASQITVNYGIHGLSNEWGIHLNDYATNAGLAASSKREIEDLNNELQGITNSLPQQIQQAQQDLQAAEQGLQQQEALLQHWNSQIQQKAEEYTNAMNQCNKYDKQPESQKLQACIQQITRIISGLEEEKDDYIAEQKISITGLASTILQSIARQEMGVQGIKLDDAYTIMLESPPPVHLRYTHDSPRPSKGEKQVIAISFVLALTRFANKERPIFVDSPFMRLDGDYSKKMAEAIVNQDTQTIILYQPDEIKSGTAGSTEGLDVFRQHLASEWIITALDREQSKIEEVN